MNPNLHYDLYEFAQRVRAEETPETAAHIFITSLANGMSMSRKESLYRDIISRMAFEIGLDIDLATTQFCECGCGQEFEVASGPGRERRYFNAACRKRAQRKREGGQR